MVSSIDWHFNTGTWYSNKHLIKLQCGFSKLYWKWTFSIYNYYIKLSCCQGQNNARDKTLSKRQWHTTVVSLDHPILYAKGSNHFVFLNQTSLSYFSLPGQIETEPKRYTKTICFQKNIIFLIEFNVHLSISI